jgi:magnesium-dependent phosphatase 1
MLFFDDEERNIIEVGKLGVTCIHVDDSKGVNWKIFQEGLAAFDKRISKL